MSPIGSDDTSQWPSPARNVHDTDVQGLNVAADPFELFEGTRSDSGASDPHARGSRGSSESSERLDRFEGLLEGMAKQQAQFMANQVKLQEQLQRRSEPSRTTPYENQYGASSAFTDFIKARDRRMRVDSLDESMLSVGPTAPTLPVPTRPVEQATNVQQPQQAPQQQPYWPSPSPEQFVPPTNFGIKIPKPRDLDWPGFGKFSGKEVYPGLGANFKSWGLRFLKRLAAAQQMSGGDWPEEFRILALNGKLDGTALVYFERMVPLWTTESPTLEHVMNRMLVPYMTTITASKGLQLMTAEKSKSRTWAEHYHLCKSAPPYLQSAMLTRLNSQRADYLQQATELVAFAIEFDANMLKQEIGRGNRGRGGRFHGGGRGDQGGRGSVARVDGTETRSCYNCGEAGHLARDCPGKENSGAKTSTRVTLAVGTGTNGDSCTWILDVPSG
ncbi:hypothetical protein PHYSODRAFT_487665 [Phytophthora sojae]|uniref:CCHC-type domain-containing protein n=1 Tax=Phytophthora sojae (strain P6497) TaxID=1094619 RepID=G4YVQ8_PHYSP|nr:hypothetical protein PHYSODRAFT_487665 [Phytophthora sojae]EGZ23156.1 hypothetical protein PHYSODRAFT_487665 [Phytophthora sojae]|eukprot:XP_009518444.1 hypothetical protein PHYSODRAFT_487665 [Phytophthora sojae]